MKFTADDIKNINSELLNIKVHCNKGIVLDPYLINNLVDDRPRKKYDFDIYLPKYGVNLQRPYVWEDYQQSEYIISILQERPLDNIIVIQYEPEEGPITMQIVDGKQRLTTIQKFLLGEIPVTINNKKVWWYDFDEDAKRYFNHVFHVLRQWFTTYTMMTTLRMMRKYVCLTFTTLLGHPKPKNTKICSKDF